MKYKKFSSEYIVIVLVGILLFITLVLFPSHPKEPESHPAPLPKPVAVQTFQSPNKTEKEFGIGYVQQDNLTYTINPVYSYFDQSHKLEYAIFQMEYENLIKDINTFKPSNTFNVGCIAANNQGFQQTSNIFSGGGLSARHTGFPTTSLVAWSKQHSFTLQSYEKVYVQFEVNGDCQFIGTQDGQYWWPMPTFE